MKNRSMHASLLRVQCNPPPPAGAGDGYIINNEQLCDADILGCILRGAVANTYTMLASVSHLIERRIIMIIIILGTCTSSRAYIPDHD